MTANSLNLLIIDEEAQTLQVCRAAARARGYATFCVSRPEDGFRILERQSVAAVLLDLKLPGAAGLQPLRTLKSRWPATVAIVMARFASVEAALQAMKLGACDYLAKPLNANDVTAALDDVAGHLPGVEEPGDGGEELLQRRLSNGFFGRHPWLKELHRVLGKAVHSSSSLLIVGEAGTRRESLARLLHAEGPLRHKPFVPLDCCLLSTAVLERELFGSDGAERSNGHTAARQLLAQGGTLFLEEVGALSLALQARLLRTIEHREFAAEGSAGALPFNARIVSATGTALETAVAEGRFRRDLYFRLNVLTLRLPPLRERTQDIPVLAQHLLQKLGAARGIPYRLSDDAMAILLAYAWPGNIGELEACLKRACLVSAGPVLPAAAFALPPTDPGLPSAPAERPHPHIVPLSEVEKQAILRTISHVSGDKLMAAKLLGMGKTTLYRKLRDYGLV